MATNATAPTLSAIAIATEFNRLLLLRGTRSLWAEALPWLMEICYADGISLVYLNAGHLRVREGHIPPEVSAHLSEWEEQWTPEMQHATPPTHTPPAIIQEHTTPSGYRLIHFPLLVEGRPLGTLTFVYVHPERGTYARHPVVQALVRSVAHLAYLQDALQYSQERLEQVAMFYQIGQNLASSLDLNQVLRDTIELTMVILDAEAATLFLLDEERQELVFAIPTGEKGEELRELRISVGEGIAGWVVQTGQSELVNDVQNDPRFLRQVDSQTGFTTRNLLCVPLQYQGRIIGALETINKRSATGFTPEDLQWLTTLATQAAIAIENARLYESLRQERDRIIAVQEEVRHRLARALHDGPAQDLARLILDIDYTRKLLAKHPESVPQVLDEMEEIARRANRTVRQFLFELRPIILETRGLVAALHAYLEQWQNSEDIQCHLEVEDFPSDLDTTAAGTLFGIIQEAFNNLRKHAQAKNVWVRLRRQDDTLEIEVEDDGRGFDVTGVLESYEERNSFGLLNMREQAELLEGQFIVQSPSPRLGRGTRILVRVPYQRVRHKTSTK